MIEEIVSSNQKDEEADDAIEKDEEEINWNLHEDIFKQTGQANVNPDHLKKSSAQMYAVYKYYGDNTLKVKNLKYTETDEYQEVKTLMKKKSRFFDAPEVKLNQEMQPPMEV